MKNLKPAIAGAAFILGAIPTALADSSLPPTHPADTTSIYPAADTTDPFSLRVPLLDRAAPTPSYAQPASIQSPGAREMDHSKMPGMSPASE